MATHQEDTTSSKSYAAACGGSSTNYEPSGPEGLTRNAHSVDGSRDNVFSPDINSEALDHAQKFYEQFSYALTKMNHRGDMFKLWNDAYVPTTEGARSVDFNKVLYAMAFGLKVCRVKQNTHVLWKVNRPRDDRGHRDEQPRYRDDRGRRDEQPRYYRDDRGRCDEQPRYRDDRGRRDEQPRYRDDRGRRDEQPRYRDDRGRRDEQESRHEQPHQSRWDRN